MGEVMAIEFELDIDGNVRTSALLGCAVVPVADTAVLLQLRYADSLQDVASGGKAVQAMLPVEAALRLAADLHEVAKNILEKAATAPSH